ncbi:crotonase/enoyl-CoA hydratase family protein [Enterovirga aerilata]|uniref:Crotonase/enoyl-CoA hydratase family protein n=1 Tax=Enterovirga aerilata TaxID=2730920 RepID=A0A849I8R8_9HYPH|nr:crotonase/enoyl-CoA hydratase family protein [Enterovirga sp. DB1703]NNM73788.1 crotonase/enoyl-CoA hydratase family protein [Enterovirga sp. DB1703]
MPDGLPDLPASLSAERDRELLRVRLRRPEKRNALNDPTVLGLDALFSALPGDIRAVVLEGEGAHFCAGLDLSELRERDATAGVHHSMMWHRAFEKIQFGPVPVIAVLNGAVIGGGLELACAAHIRVAETNAFYALPEGQRGIFVGGGASVRLPRLIGVARMMDMMLTGRTYTAEEGLALGFSQYLVETGEGAAKATELARRVAGNAPMTNLALLQVLPRIAEANPATGFVTEALMAAIAQSDPEAKARLRDFLEKRAAKVAPG